ncbi:hypothetical protein MF6394_21100 [Pseudomonas sp. MF6394]|nr:hypothetical protein MF6394_21100 [Pseudomonas sp. MF6394]
MLAKNSRAPRSFRMRASSLTIFASKLAPTGETGQLRSVITGQPRFSASARKFGSGSTATG